MPRCPAAFCARWSVPADMPIAEPRRVDLEAVEPALLGCDTPERALRHGRAANIAEADEHRRCFTMRALFPRGTCRGQLDLARYGGS